MHATRLLRAKIVALIVAVAAPTAGSVDWGMSDSTLQDLSYDATQSLLTRDLLRDAGQSRRARATRAYASSAGTLASAAIEPSVAQRLAARYPAKHRAEIERTFQQLLNRHLQIEDHFGIPRFDVAGAVAAFIAGAVMAYRNEGFPDVYFKPLVDQIRDVLVRNHEFARASAEERRETYEKLTILGMSMAAAQISLQQRPDPVGEARMRMFAKAQLEKFLGVDAKRVVITTHGLALR